LTFLISARRAQVGFRGPEKVEAQPIGISAAPNSAGQARGEGERLAGAP
jgi:hypothetical protein